MNKEQLEKKLTRIEHHIARCRESLLKLREKLNLTGTAGECTRQVSHDKTMNCPVHGEMLRGCADWMSMTRHNRERRALGGDSTPDLPLHARVAKALGKIPPMDRGVEEFLRYHIPPYDTDLVAAMGALEEYCEKHDFAFNVGKYLNGISVHINAIWFPRGKRNYQCSLPQAICEAIVAHREGK